jgi:thymidylate synthase
MLTTTANSANQAWKQTFQMLLEKGEITNNEKYLRDEVMLIEISNPEVLPADIRFPMSQNNLDIINRYIYTGENEGKVVHDWTKIYYHRAFDQPNSQIEFLISHLDEQYPVGEAQISMWDKNIDQFEKISPCTQIIWARIKQGKLELHVHTNSSDAYKKLLMNILEFISLQHYIAARVGVPVGKYYHFLDSCHLHIKDSEAIYALKQQIIQ